MTLFDLYNEGESILKSAGVDDAAIDARLLLLEAFSIDLNAYLLNRDKELLYDETALEKISRYRSFLDKRAARIPLQLIVGSTVFMGLTFSVRENVLIPRQETEILVERVLSDCAGPAGDFADSLLDLCTGSGCIAVSLAVRGNFKRIAASDISSEAIDAARENAGRYDLSKIEFYQGDLFFALPRKTPPFSVITVNPPYIPTADIASLQPEVRDHEPLAALDGSSDGLAFYRRIAREAPCYLAPGGRIYMETCPDESRAVCDIFKDAGFGGTEIVKDLSGNDRVVIAKALTTKV